MLILCTLFSTQCLSQQINVFLPDYLILSPILHKYTLSRRIKGISVLNTHTKKVYSLVMFKTLLPTVLSLFKGVLHPRLVFGLFLHFSQKLQHIGNK